eukprot:6232339-Heterocapsa_arctica.AAC.1
MLTRVGVSGPGEGAPGTQKGSETSFFQQVSHFKQWHADRTARQQKANRAKRLSFKRRRQTKGETEQKGYSPDIWLSTAQDSRY